MVLTENRKLYNEVQDLKGVTLFHNKIRCLSYQPFSFLFILKSVSFAGNIRVYCRIRPFLPGQSEKQTTIEYIGENGELLVANPSKQGKDGCRMFKFNKVYGLAASQGFYFLPFCFHMRWCDFCKSFHTCFDLYQKILTFTFLLIHSTNKTIIRPSDIISF